MSRKKTTGIICTILGGMLSLWVIARLSSATGWEQTWAPPLVEYEWVTLLGAAVAAGFLIIGLIGVTGSMPTETMSHGESMKKDDTSSNRADRSSQYMTD